MIHIYLYHDEKKAGSGLDSRILEAVRDYERSLGKEPGSYRVARHEGKKPFLEEAGGPSGSAEKNGGEKIPPFFSVSHSGPYWAAAVSSREIGFDIQEEKKVDQEKLLRHFFKPEEQEACLRGDIGFFSLFMRREAVGKLTGEGFFGEMPLLTEERVLLRGRPYRLYEAALPENRKGILAVWEEKGMEETWEIYERSGK